MKRNQISIKKLLDLIFPKRCFACKKENTFLCNTCESKLPHPEQVREEQSNILAATSYQSFLVKKMIRSLKYRKTKELARIFANLMSERIHPEKLNADLLIPVPLSNKRMRQRNFNQAEEIAKNLSNIMSIRLEKNVLYKSRHTVSQTKTKSRKERLLNVKDSFSVKNTDLIKDKIILVVDDVSTTGATINEACKALLEAGAKRVKGIVVAK